jgi:uncharacterized membrane protein YkvI
MLVVLFLVAFKGNGRQLLLNENVFDALVNGVNYVFINIVTLGMFILEIGQRYNSKEKFIISVGSSVIVGIFLFVLNFAIMRNNLVFKTMPNLIISRCNGFLFFSMQICIYLGLFTTIISNILIVSNFIKKYIRSMSGSIIITLIISFIMSFWGFEFIVGYIYSFIGVVGIILFWGVILRKKEKAQSLF